MAITTGSPILIGPRPKGLFQYRSALRAFSSVSRVAQRDAGMVGGQRNRSHPGRPWPGVLLSVAFWKPGRTDA